MRKPTITGASVLVMLLAAAGAHAQSYVIGGKTYVPTFPTETIGVTFMTADGGVTSSSYSGFVRVVVSGSGVSCTPATNDAFWIYQWVPGCGNPNVVPQHDAWYYQLTFDTRPLVPLNQSRVATNFIYYNIDAGVEVVQRPHVPAYRVDHTYSFIINTGLASPGPLHFGVSDGGFGDNSGAYQIQVTQLIEGSAPIQVTSLSANGTSPFTPGSSVTFTATASGGQAPLQYQFWLFREGAQWSVLQPYSAANQVTWTASLAGAYVLQVWVRSAGSTAAYEAWGSYGPFEVRFLPLQVTSLTANVQFPSVAGMPVTWTAATSGGVGPYTYRFWVFDGLSWVLAREWSGANTWTWEPPLPGNYAIQVWVRNAGSSTALDAWQSASATIAAPPVLTVTKVTPSAMSVAAGAPVTWTAMAAGGNAPYTYRFFVFDGASWSVGQDWSTSNAWTWVAPAAGTYSFQVWVRNAGSSAAWDAWRPFGPYTSTRPSALNVTSLSTDLPAPIAAGTPVVWTATAAGGTAPYSYKFYVYDGVTWSVARDWGPSAQWTWVPPAAGSYAVQVWARNDGSGTDYDAWRGAAYAVTAPAPLSVATPAADRLFPAPAGTPVTWTARAVGGTGPYSFKFWVFDGSTWSVGQDWSTANTWTWVPTASGTYWMQVWVRNAGSVSAYDGWAPSPAVVSNAAALSTPTVTVSPLAPLVAHGPAVITANVKGGTGPYTYQFYVFDGATWSIGQGWSMRNTFVWQPSLPGTYYLQVWVRNAGSAAPYDQWSALGPLTVLP